MISASVMVAIGAMRLVSQAHARSRRFTCAIEAARHAAEHGTPLDLLRITRAVEAGSSKIWKTSRIRKTFRLY